MLPDDEKFAGTASRTPTVRPRSSGDGPSYERSGGRRYLVTSTLTLLLSFFSSGLPR